MKHLLYAMLFVPLFACAQATKAPAPAPAAPPAATPPAGSPNVCDQTFSAVTETAEGDLVMYLPGPFLAAQPWVDVQSNHAEQVKVLSVLSKEQNKGGPYTITVSETIACDGGATKRVADGSIYVEGVTLNGMNKAAREMLKSADVIIKRYEDRDKAGAKVAWNHKNAQKVQRDDLGHVLPPGQAKKQ